MFSTDVSSAGDSSGLADSVIGSVGSGVSGVSSCDTVPEPVMAEPERKEVGLGVGDSGWDGSISGPNAAAKGSAESSCFRSFFKPEKAVPKRNEDVGDSGRGSPGVSAVVAWSSAVSSCAAFAEVPQEKKKCLSASAATSGNAISSRERSSGSSELVVPGAFAAEGLPKRKGADDVLSPSSTVSGARLASE